MKLSKKARRGSIQIRYKRKKRRLGFRHHFKCLFTCAAYLSESYESCLLFSSVF
uniref:Uncharacterized protein n=1 Tax=Anguilla anguilla TaxID=7936 RepID=A0A0E9VW77_ANGAN